jgi:uncharacterized protein
MTVNVESERTEPSGGYAGRDTAMPPVPERTSIWIDLDNTPHVPLFVPIIRELEQRNIRVVLTARNAFQVCELATRYGLTYETIGRHYGKNVALKIFGWLWRAVKLIPFALREKPALALSHGSRSQPLIANLLGIPTVVIMDYEFAKIPPFSRPKWEIVPEIISTESLTAKHILKYPGIKEDVYVLAFTPDPALLEELGVAPSDLLVTVRPPATEAHYHNPEGEALLRDIMAAVLAASETKVVLLPRNEKQGQLLRQQNPDWFAAGRVIIPRRAINGLNLVYFSDFVISGGGTMNREAAALRVPAYSIFCGSMGAVDKQLEAEGRLVMIRTSAAIPATLRISRRDKTGTFQAGPRPALLQIIGHIESIARHEARGKTT